MSHKLSDFSVQIPINKELCAFQDEVKSNCMTLTTLDHQNIS